MTGVRRERYAVIAAAGRGRRFRHQVPKLLADVEGKPCVQRVIDAVEGGLGEHRQLVVVSPDSQDIRDALGPAPHREFVVQPEPLGTGDALRCALGRIPAQAHGSVYFFCGDKPLLSAPTVHAFRRRFETIEAPMLFLTGRIEGDDDEVRDNRQGRVVCVDHDGAPHALAIVERKVIDALEGRSSFVLCNGARHCFTRDQLLGMREINVSTYAWDLPALRKLIDRLSCDNAQHEFLVTDLVHLFEQNRLAVQTMALTDPREGKGIDTVEQWRALRAGESAR